MATSFQLCATDFQFQLYLLRGLRECFAPKNACNPGVLDEADEISVQAFFEDRWSCDVAGLVVFCSPPGKKKIFLHFLRQSLVWYLVDRKGATIHDWPAWSLSWHGPTWVTKPTGLHNSEVFNFWVVGASLSGILECRHTEWGYKGLTNGPSVLGRLLWYHLARLYLFRENLEWCVSLPAYQSCVQMFPV